MLIKELDMICVCGKCPTYIGTGEKKLTLCAIGKSIMIKKIKAACVPTVLSRRALLSDGIATASRVQARNNPG